MDDANRTLAVRTLVESARLIFLDFDGVIVDSAAAKLDAFERVLPDDPRVHEYLVFAQGKTRYEKFARVYQEILERDYSRAIEASLDEQLTFRLSEAAAGIGLVAGVEVFLEAMWQRTPLVVVSAAPPTEVTSLMERHQIRHYFDEVYAGVVDKAYVLREVCDQRRVEPASAVFFGDTISDYNAASGSGVGFVGVIKAGDATSTLSGVDLLFVTNFLTIVEES